MSELSRKKRKYVSYVRNADYMNVMDCVNAMMGEDLRWNLIGVVFANGCFHAFLQHEE